MCTYLTEHLQTTGSGKGPGRWFRFTEAMLYYDHPQDAPLEHSVNLDFLAPAEGPSARIALEMSPEAAKAVAEAIMATLGSFPG